MIQLCMSTLNDQNVNALKLEKNEYDIILMSYFKKGHINSPLV